MITKPLIAANWKMYRDHLQEIEYCRQHIDQYKKLSQNPHVEIALFPGFTALASIAQLLHGTSIVIGAQDCSSNDHGAYTGQVSALSLKQLGCTYVIIGHSERRAIGETNKEISQKIAQAFKAGLCPIICIGESDEAYNYGQTKKFLTTQLDALEQVLTEHQNKSFCIAYEPGWAIGTGKTPSLEEITEVETFIRATISTKIGATAFRVLYGGSVDANNSKELKQLSPFEGLLIGKASLNVEEFGKIIK